MICDLSKKALLEDLVTKDLGEIGLTPGRYYRTDYILDLMPKLHALSEKYYGTSFIEGDLSGNNLVRVSIMLPEDLIEAVQEDGTVDPGLGSIYRDNYFQLTAKAIRKVIGEDVPVLKDLIIRAQTQAIVSNQGRLRKALEDLPEDVQIDLQNIRTKLEALDQTDLEEMSEALSAYILEADTFTRKTLEKMQELDGDPDSFYKYMQLNQLVESYGEFFKELERYNAGNENPISQLIQRINFNVKAIENRYVEKALEFSLDKYDLVYEPILRKQRAELDRTVERLQRQLQETASEDVRERLSARIKELRENFDKEAPTRDRLRNILLGKEGDISMFTSYIRAGVANPDLIISGLVDAVKTELNQVERELIDLRQEASEYLEDYNQKGFNTQERFKELTEFYTEYYHKEGDVLERTRVKLLNDFDAKFLTDRSQFEARKEALRYRRDFMDEDTAVELDQLEKEFKEWRLANHEHKFVDYYYQVDKLLDEVVAGKTVREWRDESMLPKRQLLAEIRYQGYIPTNEQIQLIRELDSEFAKLRSFEGKVEGTPEHRIATVLEMHGQEMRHMREYQMTDKAWERFHQAVKEIEDRFRKGEITQEERANWYMMNTKEELHPQYWEKLNRIHEQLREVSRKFAALTGTKFEETEGGAYDKLRNLTRPYRDRNGVIDGSLASLELLDEVREEEQRILEERFNEVQWHGLSRADKVRLQELYNERDLQQTLYDYTKSEKVLEALNAVWAEINAINQRKTPVTEAIKELQLEQQKLFAELGEMSSKVNTDYYEAEYERQLTKYLAEKELSLIPVQEFELDEATYYAGEDGIWYVSYEGETTPLQDGQEIQAWRRSQERFFRGSEWYQANHVTEYKWDKQTEQWEVRRRPSYAWIHSRPSDPNDILENQPAWHWKEQQVFEKYRGEGPMKDQPLFNPNYSLDLRGKPMPKKAKWQNQRYQQLSDNSRTYLENMRGMYYKHQELLPESQRLIDALPAIERRNTLLENVLNPDAVRLKKQMSREVFLTDQDVDEAYGDVSNRLVKFQPMYFTGQIDPDVISLNIHESILKYSGQALKYSRLEKSTVPMVSATEAILTRYKPDLDQNNKVLRRLGMAKKLTKSEDYARLTLYNQFVDMLLFGEREVKSLSVEIGDKGILHTGVGANKTLEWKKIHGKLSGFRAFGMMVGSVLPQTANAANGIVQQIVKASMHKSGANFTYRSWAKAWTSLPRYLGDYFRDMQSPGNKSKFTLMMDYFQAIPNDVLNTVGYELEQSGIKRAMSTDIFFLVKNSVEFSLSATNFLAMARSTYVNPTTTLWDAFEVRNGRLELKEGLEFTTQQQDSFIRQLNAINMDVNGNYAQIDKTLAERNWWGSALFFMKKFMVPFFEARYSARRWSMANERYVEGYWRTGMKFGLSNLRYFRDPKMMLTSYNMLTEEEQLGVSRFVKELAIWALLATILGMFFDSDDEDRFQDLEKRSLAYQTLIYSLFKTRTEVETFMFPMNVNEVLKIAKRTPNDMFPLLTNIWDIAAKDFSADFLFEEDGDFLVKYKSSRGGVEKGDIRLMHDLAKMVGAMPYKVSDPVTGLRNLEFANR